MDEFLREYIDETFKVDEKNKVKLQEFTLLFRDWLAPQVDNSDDAYELHELTVDTLRSRSSKWLKDNNYKVITKGGITSIYGIKFKQIKRDKIPSTDDKINEVLKNVELLSEQVHKLSEDNNQLKEQLQTVLIENNKMKMELMKNTQFVVNMGKDVKALLVTVEDNGRVLNNTIKYMDKNIFMVGFSSELTGLPKYVPIKKEDNY